MEGNLQLQLKQIVKDFLRNFGSFSILLQNQVCQGDGEGSSHELINRVCSCEEFDSLMKILARIFEDVKFFTETLSDLEEPKLYRKYL